MIVSKLDPFPIHRFRHLFALVLFCSAPAAAQTVRLTVGTPLIRFDRLVTGTHRYLRYTVKGETRAVIDIWSRTLAFETHDGARSLHITQRWDEAADKAVLLQDSWFEPGTFRPKTHVRHLERDGKTTISGYQFEPDQVVGMADLIDNVRKDFVKALPEPSYNFETDMEFLQALPLAAGRDFNIPFYDAGIDEPNRYIFKVAGGERIPGPDGRLIDCWLVTADYNTGKVTSRFWFAKSTQVLIREEVERKSGDILVKALLSSESTDSEKVTKR
jgi:hypothetical protein